MALGSVPHVVNLVVIPGAARRPVGRRRDARRPDRARRTTWSRCCAPGASTARGRSRSSASGTVLSTAADAAAAAAPGSSSEAVVWAEVEARSRGDDRAHRQLRADAGARHADRRRRDPHRLADPGHRSDGRSGPSTGRSSAWRSGCSVATGGTPPRRCARSVVGLRWRHRGVAAVQPRRPGIRRSTSARTRPGHGRSRSSSAIPTAGRSSSRSWPALAGTISLDAGAPERAGRRVHLGHHDPRRREHRCRRRVRRAAARPWALVRPAAREPGADRGRRSDHVHRRALGRPPFPSPPPPASLTWSAYGWRRRRRSITNVAGALIDEERKR